jgi:hypothetical protein
MIRAYYLTFILCIACDHCASVLVPDTVVLLELM